MRIILVRHAETAGNRHRYVGREDLPLNAVGLIQSSRLVETLRPEPIGRIFSSPLRRALDTVRPLAEERNLTVEARDGLVEIDFGDLQGDLKGERSFNLRKEFLVKSMPGGESLQDVWRRLDVVVCDLRCALNHHRTILVCGHYWSNRVLLAKMRGLKFDSALRALEYKPTNASALAIDFDSVFAQRLQFSWLGE